MSAGTSASAVSAVLRRGGLTPVPRHSRDGISVGGGRPHTSVSVIASIASVTSRARREEIDLTDQAFAILERAGYGVTRVNDHHLLVAKILPATGAAS